MITSAQVSEVALKEICQDNADAYAYCLATYHFLHLIDDLVDRDQETPAKRVAEGLLAYTNTLLFNPFAQAHRQYLMPTFDSAIRAWAASERLRASDDVQKKLSAETLKSQYQDIFFRVAHLVGGSEWAWAMDEKYREYCFG